MKEFIDKLISRLEDENEHSYDDCTYEEISGNDVKYYKGMMDGFDKAISIINELAEEYNGGFCEWKKQTIGGIELIREPHRMYLFKTSEDEWVFCPYCGKKIIVAPYTEGE